MNKVNFMFKMMPSRMDMKLPTMRDKHSIVKTPLMDVSQAWKRVRIANKEGNLCGSRLNMKQTLSEANFMVRKRRRRANKEQHLFGPKLNMEQTPHRANFMLIKQKEDTKQRNPMMEWEATMMGKYANKMGPMMDIIMMGMMNSMKGLSRTTAGRGSCATWPWRQGQAWSWATRCGSQSR